MGRRAGILLRPQRLARARVLRRGAGQHTAPRGARGGERRGRRARAGRRRSARARTACEPARARRPAGRDGRHLRPVRGCPVLGRAGGAARHGVPLQRARRVRRAPGRGLALVRALSAVHLDRRAVRGARGGERRRRVRRRAEQCRERASPAHRGAARRVLPVRFRVRPAVLAYRVSGAVVSGQGRARDAHRARQPAGGAERRGAGEQDRPVHERGGAALRAGRREEDVARRRFARHDRELRRAAGFERRRRRFRHRRAGRRARVLQHRLLRLAGAHLGSGRSRARGAGGGGTAGRGGERGIPGESRALQAVRRARRGRACARHRGRPAVGAHRVPLLRGDRGRDRGRAARSAARAVARRAEVAHARDDGALPRRVLLAGDRAHRGARDGRGARRAGQAPAGIARGGRFAPRLRGAGAQGRAVGGAGRGARARACLRRGGGGRRGSRHRRSPGGRAAGRARAFARPRGEAGRHPQAVRAQRVRAAPLRRGADGSRVRAARDRRACGRGLGGRAGGRQRDVRRSGAPGRRSAAHGARGGRARRACDRGARRGAGHRLARARAGRAQPGGLASVGRVLGGQRAELHEPPRVPARASRGDPRVGRHRADHGAPFGVARSRGGGRARVDAASVGPASQRGAVPGRLRHSAAPQLHGDAAGRGGSPERGVRVAGGS